TLYRLLTGRVPFPSEKPVDKMIAHLEQPPTPLAELRPDAPAALAAVLQRMLAKDPDGRYRTAAQGAAALEPFTPAPDTDQGRAEVWEKRRVGVPRRRWSVIATAMLLFLVAGLLGAAVYRIATDKGELVITTESDDVKVVITKGGKLVDVIDTKTDEQIRLNLRSGEYDLELKGAPEGLKLSIGKATLTRGETVLATITTETLKPSASKYIILPIDKVASAVSTKGLFSPAEHERYIFPTWGEQEVFGIPFDVIDPKIDSVKNAIVLHAPMSALSREMPQAVELKCGSAA